MHLFVVGTKKCAVTGFDLKPLSEDILIRPGNRFFKHLLFPNTLVVILLFQQLRLKCLHLIFVTDLPILTQLKFNSDLEPALFRRFVKLPTKLRYRACTEEFTSWMR